MGETATCIAVFALVTIVETITLLFRLTWLIKGSNKTLSKIFDPMSAPIECASLVVIQITLTRNKPAVTAAIQKNRVSGHLMLSGFSKPKTKKIG